MRHSAQETKSDSSEDAKFFILFQSKQQNHFAGVWILERKAGGRSYLFFTLIYCLIIETH